LPIDLFLLFEMHHTSRTELHSCAQSLEISSH